MGWGQRILELLRLTARQWRADKTQRLGAALAYFTTLSLAPLLVIAIAIAGLVYGEEAARGAVAGQMEGLIGGAGAQVVQDMIVNAQRHDGGGGALILGFVFLLFAASGVFGQLQDALNTIWNVEPKPGLGIWYTIRIRFFSFSLVLGTGFLLLVSLLVNALLAAAYGWLQNQVPQLGAVWPWLNSVLSLLVISALFAVLFRYLPDARIEWQDVLVGALVTALLFQFGKYLLGLYLGRGTFVSTYGAAGAVLVILVWVYYAAQILFFGAEFTQVYAVRYGSGVQPTSDAVRSGTPRLAERESAASPEDQA